MSLNTLPKSVAALLEATAAKDRAALLATFADDAALDDMGKEMRGDAIGRWADTLYLGVDVIVHPLDVEVHEGRISLAVALDGDYRAFGLTGPFQFEWTFDLEGDRIKRLSMVEVELDLPKPVLTLVQAMNMYDLDRLVSVFAKEAMVNDQKRDFSGRDAIRRWAAKEIVGDKVTMYVTRSWSHVGGLVVEARVTGDYDKTGLPDPLALSFYFTLTGDEIAQLIILPTRPAA